MARKLLLLLTTLCTTSIWHDLKAQDPQFTQFYANPLYLNPAFAGTARCPRICMNYRNQWPNLSFEEKRNIIETITEKIVIHSDSIDIALSYLPTPILSQNAGKRQHDFRDSYSRST